MSLTLAFTVLIVTLVFVAIALLPAVGRERAYQFVLWIDEEYSVLLDTEDSQVLKIGSGLSYRRSRDSLKLTAVGDKPRTQDHEYSVRLADLVELSDEDASELFAAFLLYSLTRGRLEQGLAWWRYASVSVVIDERLSPLLSIATRASQMRALRNDVREVALSASPRGSPAK